MNRSLLAAASAVLALVLCPVAGAAPPSGFTPPATLGANLQVSGVVAAADAAGGQDAAVAFTDRSGGVWAARVRPDGSFGAPLPASSSQVDVRDVGVAVTDRGELVVVWAALLDRRGHFALRYAVAAPGRSFSGARTLATLGSNTSATPRLAALRGATVAVIFRDLRPGARSGVLRYARRAARGSFGRARSLGRDGVFPQIQATPGGGALLAWAQGPLSRRTLMVASARRGAALPGRASPVAGRVRAVGLFAGADGTAWVAWTSRESGALARGAARRVRAADAAAVGPVQQLGTVTYGSPHVALGGSGQLLAAWNQRGPDVRPNVQLAAATGSGATLGAASDFEAGGFSQTSPIPALLGATPLVLFTRQIADPTGAPAEAAVADPATGEATVLGGAGNIGPPAVAHAGGGLVVAWAARGGGVAVSVHP